MHLIMSLIVPCAFIGATYFSDITLTLIKGQNISIQKWIRIFSLSSVCTNIVAAWSEIFYRDFGMIIKIMIHYGYPFRIVR